MDLAVWSVQTHLHLQKKWQPHGLSLNWETLLSYRGVNEYSETWQNPTSWKIQRSFTPWWKHSWVRWPISNTMLLRKLWEFQAHIHRVCILFSKYVLSIKLEVVLYKFYCQYVRGLASHEVIHDRVYFSGTPRQAPPSTPAGSVSSRRSQPCPTVSPPMPLGQNLALFTSHSIPQTVEIDTMLTGVQLKR